jgi:predicted transcriptional regulator
MLVAMAEPLPKLGPLEVQVLEHLWRAGDCDVLGAHAAVGAARGIAVNTVGSALERLHRKGLAERWKVAHAYRYRAAQTREELAARRVLEAAGGGGALAEPSLMAAFVDALATRDAAHLDRLEELIARKRAERGS